MSRVRVAATVRVNAFAVVERAIEEGLRTGWRRAHKHTDDPGEDTILEHQERAVIEHLCEVLRFDDP